MPYKAPTGRPEHTIRWSRPFRATDNKQRQPRAAFRCASLRRWAGFGPARWACDASDDHRNKSDVGPNQKLCKGYLCAVP
jgi:hypothetical protein